MHSDAATVVEYLAGLPPDRREQLDPVHRTVRGAVPDGYAETMAYGMITWSVPLETYPGTYTGQPLAYVSLAAQKRHNGPYLMGLSSDSAQAETFRRGGPTAQTFRRGGPRTAAGSTGHALPAVPRPAGPPPRPGRGDGRATPPERQVAQYERARAERPGR